MPLTETCKEYVGRSLFVLPYYGYGWSRKDSGAPPKARLDKLGPQPFHLPVGEFISCDSQLMGMSGAIDETKHELNGYWCCCLLRNTDDSDFTNHPGKYMIWIAQRRLPVHPAPYPKKALYEWVTFDKSQFCLCGFGAVAESEKWIQDIYERTMNSRRLVAGQAG
jgi:hypothetical protein